MALVQVQASVRGLVLGWASAPEQESVPGQVQVLELVQALVRGSVPVLELGLGRK